MDYGYSDIHGNELTGATLLLNLLRILGLSESPVADRWRDELTLAAVPMVNRDAADFDHKPMNGFPKVLWIHQKHKTKPAWDRRVHFLIRFPPSIVPPCIAPERGGKVFPIPTRKDYLVETGLTEIGQPSLVSALYRSRNRPHLRAC